MEHKVIICPKCGEKNSIDEHFCKRCRSALFSAEEPVEETRKKRTPREIIFPVIRNMIALLVSFLMLISLLCPLVTIRANTADLYPTLAAEGPEKITVAKISAAQMFLYTCQALFGIVQDEETLDAANNSHYLSLKEKHQATISGIENGEITSVTRSVKRYTKDIFKQALNSGYSFKYDGVPYTNMLVILVLSFVYFCCAMALLILSGANLIKIACGRSKRHPVSVSMLLLLPALAVLTGQGILQLFATQRVAAAYLDSPLLYDGALLQQGGPLQLSAHWSFMPVASIFIVIFVTLLFFALSMVEKRRFTVRGVVSNAISFVMALVLILLVCGPIMKLDIISSYADTDKEKYTSYAWEEEDFIKADQYSVGGYSDEFSGRSFKGNLDKLETYNRKDAKRGEAENLLAALMGDLLSIVPYDFFARTSIVCFGESNLCFLLFFPLILLMRAVQYFSNGFATVRSGLRRKNDLRLLKVFFFLCVAALELVIFLSVAYVNIGIFEMNAAFEGAGWDYLYGKIFFRPSFGLLLMGLLAFVNMFLPDDFGITPEIEADMERAEASARAARAAQVTIVPEEPQRASATENKKQESETHPA